MSDHIRATINELQADIRKLEEKVVKTKQLINLLCEREDMSPLYADAELKVGGHQPDGESCDEFFTKPLNFSARTFLARRKKPGPGPASVEEIYEGLIAGGYEKFPANRDEALNGLRISLGKSSHTFVKLPNGLYGLTEWYDIKRSAKNGAKVDGEKTVDKPVDAAPPAADAMWNAPENSDEPEAVVEK